MNKGEWLRTVTPFDVLCPRCGWRFKEVWLGMRNWCGEMSKVSLCRKCAEEVHKKLPGLEVSE